MAGGGGGGMMDPGSMMASMAMGGAVGSGMAGAVGGMMQGMNQDKQTPPPPPQVQYNISVWWTKEWPFWLGYIKGNGTKQSNHKRHICLETRNGKMGVCKRC